jgi:hypothetical protein
MPWTLLHNVAHRNAPPIFWAAYFLASGSPKFFPAIVDMTLERKLRLRFSPTPGCIRRCGDGQGEPIELNAPAAVLASPLVRDSNPGMGRDGVGGPDWPFRLDYQ